VPNDGTCDESARETSNIKYLNKELSKDEKIDIDLKSHRDKINK